MLCVVFLTSWNFFLLATHEPQWRWHFADKGCSIGMSGSAQWWGLWQVWWYCFCFLGTGHSALALYGSCSRKVPHWGVGQLCGFQWAAALGGQEFPCCLYELVQSCIEKGFPVFLGRAWDSQSSPKLDYSNMVIFEMNSVSSGVLALAHYSVQSVFL